MRVAASGGKLRFYDLRGDCHRVQVSVFVLVGYQQAFGHFIGRLDHPAAGGCDIAVVWDNETFCRLLQI